MSSIFRRTLLVIVLLAPACFAQGNKSADSRLVGEWQLGLNKENQSEPAIENMSAGLLGPIWRFNADHTFVIYFPCDLDMPLKLKDAVARGNWEITRAGQLQVSITEKGDWRGGPHELYDLAFTSKKGELETIHFSGSSAGRFDPSRLNCGKSTKYLHSR